MPLNIDALAAIDPSYRDLVEVRTRPTPQLGDWNAANIAEQKAFQLWTDKEPIPQFWAFWPDGEHDVWGLKIEPSPPVKPRVLGPAPGAAVTPVVASPAPAPAEPKPLESQPPAAAPAEAPPQTKEPLFGKQLHVAGHLSKKDKSITLFIISDGTRRMFEVTSEDLEAAGYSVKRLANCMVTVKFEGVVRPVTCDAPYLNTGGQDKPLVVDAATGSRSDGRNTRYSSAPMPLEVAQVRQQQAGGYLEALARRNSQVRSVLMEN